MMLEMKPDFDLVIKSEYGRDPIPDTCPFCNVGDLNYDFEGQWDLTEAFSGKLELDNPIGGIFKIKIMNCKNGHRFKCVWAWQKNSPYKSTQIYNITSPPKIDRDLIGVCPNCGKTFGKTSIFCGGYGSGWYGCWTKLKKEYIGQTDLELSMQEGNFKCPKCNHISHKVYDANDHYKKEHARIW